MPRTTSSWSTEVLQSLTDNRIPSLIDNTLQNVYTKNPILDVENLVRHGQKAAGYGLG